MKKTVLLIVIIIFKSFSLFADEGMWLPLFIKNNEAHMKSLGMKISAEDIYSVNNNSLKDAIVRFGRGCTGMLLSEEGLMMTNYHCGFYQIQALSSLENDYLKEGFWAENKAQELPNKGLSVTFLVYMEDVTEKVLQDVDALMTQRQRNSIVERNSKKIAEEAVNGTHYEAEIKDVYNDNQYFLFVYEIFKDVRLVGTPPSSIGKFGGDSDNWMWPRHTGDFALFRIYADKDNKPAEYAPDNIPYTPKKTIPISLAGVNKGDFTFVYGFPGNTNQYATSYEIELIKKTENPISINMRQMRLEIIDAAKKQDDLVRIKYAAKQATIANAWKKWIGENRGLKRLNTIENKRQEEAAFTKWANSSPELKIKYASLISVYEEIYKERTPAVRAFRYFLEGGLGAEIVRYAYGYGRLIRTSKIKNVDQSEIESIVEQLKNAAENYFRNYDTETDKKLFAATMKAYYQSFDTGKAPEVLEAMVRKHKNDFDRLADDVFNNSIFSTLEKTERFLDKYKTRDAKKIERDPAYNLAKSMFDYYFNNTYPILIKHDNILDSLNRIYMQGLMEWQPEKVFYPNANGTLRVTYGNVDAYYPRDAVTYGYYTIIDGNFEKESLGNDDYVIPEKLRTLYQAKDFGNYSKNGTLPVCFIAKNHTTGGNSGSPVLNAYGHLVGMNFDRNWEGTMSDLNYDPEQCRNISVDMRYVLFIIDKFAGACHLIEEMTIIE